MGGYIKSTYDVQICESLNSRFLDQTILQNDPAYAGYNETFIGQLRRHRNNERLFDGNHSLDRVAYRLSHGLGAGAVPSNQGARLRWLWLLNSNSGNLSRATRTAICLVLDQVLQTNSTVQRVYFDAQVSPTASGSFELHPGNSHVPQIVNGVCLMTLDCPQDQQLPNPNPGQQADPPPPDSGEYPINNLPIPG